MRIRMKGVNKVKRVLADGSAVTYYYAWKGGPRLPGKPGDHEFNAAYNAAVARKVQPPSGSLISLLMAFQDSSDWPDLAERTRKDYAKLIKIIEGKFGDFPISALADRRTRGIFMAWRGVARRTGEGIEAAGGLWLAGAGEDPFMGAWTRPNRRQPMREGWEALSRDTRRQYLD